MLRSNSKHYFLGCVCLDLVLLSLTTAPSFAKAIIKHANDSPGKTEHAPAKRSTKGHTNLGEMLELQQLHRLYGRLTVSIIPSAVSIVSRDKDFGWICKAPSWDVVAYSKVRKIYYVYPYKSWRQNGIKTALSMENNDQFLHWPLILDSKQKYAGLDSISYDLPNGGRSSLTAGASIGKLCVAERPGLDPNVARSMNALYDLPQAKGIPLLFSRAYGGHGFGFGLSYNRQRPQGINWISTSSSRTREIDPALFVIPSGKKSASDSEVLMRSGELEDTFGQMMD